MLSSAYLSSLATLAVLLTSSVATPLSKKAITPITLITSQQWAALNSSVGGRLFAGYPLAKPCYSMYDGQTSLPDSTQCAAAQNGSTDETSIANTFGGYQNSNWGFCQSQAQACGLDFNLPQDPTYFAPPANCYQGSVPSYYIDVVKVSDVQAALRFVQKYGIALSIKNSGHDYKGRSSAPNSLALWMHHVITPVVLSNNFRPDGCAPSGVQAITIGAGQGFDGVYRFAEANNITVIGGSSRTVGPVGGWISGGGHSALSNTLGLGVDNVLQIKAVLPNGTYVTANRCKNKDIFYALRGGGGSTFGVNMEMTTTAHPQMTLQVAYIRFAAPTPGSVQKFISLAVQQGDLWASQGWGGYIVPGAITDSISGMILMTPSISYDQAVSAMKPITDYVSSLGVVPLDNGVHTETSFYQAYTKYILPNLEKVGLGVAIGSRLIPRSMFQTSAGKAQLTQALSEALSLVVAPSSYGDPQALTYGPPFQILVTAPTNYVTDNTSAVTPTWYSAAWHVVLGQAFANNANSSTIQTAFQVAHDAAQVLRDVAPNSGAYQNEADVFEPDPVDSFWGAANYEKLLAIKKAIDPNNVLTCWNCVGWDENDARYGCYPSIN